MDMRKERSDHRYSIYAISYYSVDWELAIPVAPDFRSLLMLRHSLLSSDDERHTNLCYADVKDIPAMPAQLAVIARAATSASPGGGGARDQSRRPSRARLLMNMGSQSARSRTTSVTCTSRGVRG